MTSDALFARWFTEFVGTLPPTKGLLRVRRAVPRFQHHNYFARYKVETATLDGTGQNPTDVACVVVEVSETDQSAEIAKETECPSISDL